MKFEVKRNGVVVSWTESVKCLPSLDTMRSMEDAGYKLYMDGKIYHPQKAAGKSTQVRAGK